MRRVLLAASLLATSIGGACSRPDEPVPTRSGEPTDTQPHDAATPDAAPFDAATDDSPRFHSQRCPAGMLEVEGRYCPALVHRCIDGGQTSDGRTTREPEPYYCREYEVGHAKCFGRELPRHFCIDEYEYPNRRGAIAMVMVSWFEAQGLCEQQGKRLCGDDEWTLACEGSERWPYTYGWKRDASLCNIDKRWIEPNDSILGKKDGGGPEIAAEIERLSQRVPSGSMPGCVSPYGVRDMGGNVDEWTVNVTRGGRPFRSVLKGGHWCGGARNRCRPATRSHDETTRYYAEGFRCCADPLAGRHCETGRACEPI